MGISETDSEQVSSDFQSDCGFPEGRIIKETAPPKARFSEKRQKNKSIHHQLPVPYFKGI